MAHLEQFQERMLAAVAAMSTGHSPPRVFGRPRAVLAPAPALELDAESLNSDMDEDEMSVLAAAEQDRAYLAAGTAAMRGPTGESAHLPFPVVSPALAPPTGHYLQGPLLSHAMHRARANHAVGVELTLDEVLSFAFSVEGVFLLSVSGVPHSYTVPHGAKSTAYAPKVITKLYNPDSHHQLARLGAAEQSVHLFPVTVDQFEANMNDQQLKSMRPSPLFPGISADHLVKTLFAYKRKFVTLLDGLYGGHSYTVVQAHKHHLSVWVVLMLFHYNRWMRAMVLGDIGLLLSGFDATWQSVYSVQLGTDARGLPVIQLLDALLLCCYRCPQCNRLGACAVYCTNDTCRATLTATTTAGDSSGYMVAIKAWQKLQPKGTQLDAAAHTAFLATPEAKAAGYTAKSNAAGAKKSTRGTSCQDRANEQHLITLHVCPNFQYA